VPTFAAVDLGASGGRVIRGTIDGEAIALETVHRFANGVVEREHHWRWDFSRLYREVLEGLGRIPDADSIGIDTWGVDYGLLDTDGALISEPISYRDERTAEAIDAVHRRIAPQALYGITGTQYLPFNTIYQLVAEQTAPHWERAAHAVLLPDLLAFWLTGELRSELTNASTTGLLDARTRLWSSKVLEAVGIPTGMLPPIEAPGSVRGETASGTPVVTVGSHDTASAVAAVPATNPRFAYISSGTWSLVGVELPKPILSDAARAANFTNEVGVDGRVRFLRNVGGLWLLQECLREWGRGDLEALLDAAASLPPNGPTVDVNDAVFVAPGPMQVRIEVAAGRASMTAAETVRCIFDSLALAYAEAVRLSTELSGASVDVVHVVGGGSQNALLCQLTANAVGAPVVAGPIEATGLGNVVVQARAVGALPDSMDAVRARITMSSELRRYEPA
jgi:rhamnulokinase